MKRSILSLLTAILLILLVVVPAGADEWQEIEEKARGQKIFFNAWGGSDVVNDYILWAAEEVKSRYGVTIKHVKVTDIGKSVSRVLAERSLARDSGGSIDLLWINGENFSIMKENKLLRAPYAQLLPNSILVDSENKKSIVYDFNIPVDGMEIPWGMAQLVFIYDSARLAKPPRNMKELLSFAKENPGRTTYPLPPNFHGTTFLKQALLELTPDRDKLYRPVAESDFDTVTGPLWKFLDELHPNLWRKGKAFPTNASEMKQLLADSEITISLSFNPAEASNGIATGELPGTVRTYVHETGTIGNTHFLAVPYNASSPEGALVFANFLLSPEAQARKADPTIWGDPTVLAMSKLDSSQRKMFDALSQNAAMPSPEELSRVLLEPHASWVTALEKEWEKRYSRW